MVATGFFYFLEKIMKKQIKSAKAIAFFGKTSTIENDHTKNRSQPTGKDEAMDFKNQRCDGCSRRFTGDDDIVFCPVCGTPQHRACYEAHGHCVNEDKHDSGFVWQPEELPQSKADAALAPCPVCGFENRSDARLCIHCGTPLTGAAPAQVPPPSPQQTRDLFYDVSCPDGFELDDDERAQLEALLNQRAAIAAPGMQPEQEQEQLDGHPIKQVMTFIGSNALKYLQKFRKLEHGSKLGWNWAAFFLSPYWFFYRKLYRPGIVFLTLRLCLTLLLFPYENKALDLYQALYANAANLDENAIQTALQEIMHTLTPVYIGGAVLLILAVISALLADRLYYNYVRRSIDHAKKQETRDTVLLQFFKRSGVSPLMAVLSYAAISLIPNLILSFFN